MERKNERNLIFFLFLNFFSHSSDKRQRKINESSSCEMILGNAKREKCETPTI